MRYSQIENRYGPVPSDEVNTVACWKQTLLVAGLVIVAAPVIAVWILVANMGPWN